jgi:protoporphyrin/coproporphyrin ferrochelatase
MSNQSIGCQRYGNKTGILLAQLGSPDAPTKSALRRYLRQFLSDNRVIEVWRPLWLALLYGVILWRRPQRSARLYSRIWTANGSPLVSVTQSQCIGIKERLRRKDQSVEVAYGMRYGNPSLESAIDELRNKNCSRILLVPLYPQYAGATTASTYDSVFKKILASRWVPTLRVVEPFYSSPYYLQSVASIINKSLSDLPLPPEKLLISFHGVPEKYVAKGDPYCCMCNDTAAALKPLIHFPIEDILLTFQSQFGKAPWLTPYTDDMLEALAAKGIKRVAVVCPGFVTDCLETIDEIGTESTEVFHEAGGEVLTRIPCLNDNPLWLDSLAHILEEELGTWINPDHATCEAQRDCPIMTNKGTHGPLPRILCSSWESRTSTCHACAPLQGPRS